jgi:predicted unusual protein kinase regulating ubiquinone biosynthesis (AarF/ABC1/UbiB family)
MSGRRELPGKASRVIPMSSPTRRRQSAVPSTRLGRAVRLGLMAGEVAFEGMLGSARALAAGRRPTAAGALFSVRNAETLARRLSSLRGAAMKLGQMLSVQGDELLPPEFRQALAILRSQAYAMPIEQLRRVLGREYGAGWRDRFERFDEEPLAAASIGQVHRVVTRDGRDLVLKIQYPGVARSIDSDVDNMATLLRWLDFLPVELDIAGLSGEAKRQLKVEADYLPPCSGARPGSSCRAFTATSRRGASLRSTTSSRSRSIPWPAWTLRSTRATRWHAGSRA